MLIITNGQTVATHKTLCNQLNNLPQKASSAYCIPSIHNNLLAISQLCDAGCDVTFDRIGVIIQYDGVIVLQGWQDMPSHLWRVSLTNSMGISPPLHHNTNHYLPLTTLSSISANTYTTANDHCNYISFIMPPSPFSKNNFP